MPEFATRPIIVGLSVGITLIPNHGLDPEAVFKHADAALFKAEAAGHNTSRFHGRVDEKAA